MHFTTERHAKARVSGMFSPGFRHPATRLLHGVFYLVKMEGNDSKPWGFYTASERLEKMEYFEEVEVAEIRSDHLVDSVVRFPNQFFRIVLKNGNKYDYYPKSDRLFSHLTRKWESNGLFKFKNIIGFSK